MLLIRDVFLRLIAFISFHFFVQEEASLPRDPARFSSNHRPWEQILISSDLVGCACIRKDFFSFLINRADRLLGLRLDSNNGRKLCRRHFFFLSFFLFPHLFLESIVDQSSFSYAFPRNNNLV